MKGDGMRRVGLVAVCFALLVAACTRAESSVDITAAPDEMTTTTPPPAPAITTIPDADKPYGGTLVSPCSLK